MSSPDDPSALPPGQATRPPVPAAAVAPTRSPARQPGLDLPRRTHLRASAQFQGVFRDGRRLQGTAFRLHVHLFAALPTPPDAASPAADAASERAIPAPPDPLAPARLGITVSKRVDKRAVGRNRIRRQIRECFRLQRHALPAGDYVVLALAAAAKQDAATLRAELLALFARARTLKPSSLKPGVPAVTMRPADATERHPPSAP